MDSLDIGAGEIVGFTGLPGAGAKESARAIFGLYPARGSISINGEAAQDLPKRPRMAFNIGIAYLSDDRRREGVVGQMSIGANIALSSLPSRVRWG